MSALEHPDSLRSPRPLERTDDLSDFRCGSADLDSWIREYGWVNHASGNSRIFVATRSETIVGYYALATAGVEKAEAPNEILKGGTPKQVPCLLLARLAVHLDEQGGGLGRGLLVDAIRRAVQVSANVGIRALLIHAKDKSARSFYQHLGGFVQSPSDPLHLFLHMKRARELTGESASPSQ